VLLGSCAAAAGMGPACPYDCLCFLVCMFNAHVFSIMYVVYETLVIRSIDRKDATRPTITTTTILICV